jgi:hypothetical protein
VRGEVSPTARPPSSDSTQFAALAAETDPLGNLGWAYDTLYTAIRDRTALRAELASIAIFLQERGRLPDLGGENFALVAGAVEVYVLEMELAVIAMNEERKDLLDEVNAYRDANLRVDIRHLLERLGEDDRG